MSRELPIPKKHGRPVLSDFGEARFGQEDYSGDIQPFIYRAPEVALRMRWDSKVDIWSAGMLVSFFRELELDSICDMLNICCIRNRPGISSKTNICLTPKMEMEKIPQSIIWLK